MAFGSVKQNFYFAGTSGVGRGVFPSGNKRPSASSARQRQPCQNRFITDSNNRILAGACIPIRTLSTLSNSRFSRKKRQVNTKQRLEMHFTVH